MTETEPLPLEEPEKKLCTKQACAIQYCLNRYNHQEKYCKAFIDEWKKCKDKVRQAAGIGTQPPGDSNNMAYR
jgi:hypothetical protein